MQKFDLSLWLKDKSSKVVTRDGREVDIYYSPTSRIPLIGRTSDNEIHQYTKDGFQCDTINQAKNDLFFADEEETLSTFLTELKLYLANTPREQIEKDWKEIQDWYNQHCADESNNEEQLTEFEQGIKTWMSEFLLGTEQSVPDEIVKKAAQKVLDLARKEILKDLPKWKKSKEDRVLSEGWVVKFNKDGKIIFSDIVHKGEYFIILQSLESLPKEE